MENPEEIASKPEAVGFASLKPDSQPKRKRGRPKGSGSNTKPKSKPALDSTNSSKIDASIFSETVASVLGLIDERLEKSHYKIALRITGDENFSRNLSGEGKFTEKELKAIDGATSRLAEKYGILGKFGDEFILGAVFVSYSYRQITVQNELKKIARLVSVQRQNASQSDSAQSN